MDMQEKVRQRAYEIYMKNGQRKGCELLDWLTAEQIVRFEQTIQTGNTDGQIGLLEYKPVSQAVVDVAVVAPTRRRKNQPRKGVRPGRTTP